MTMTAVARKWLRRALWTLLGLFVAAMAAHSAVAFGWVTYRSLFDWGWKSAATIGAIFTVFRSQVDKFIKEQQAEREAREREAERQAEKAREDKERQEQINENVRQIMHDFKNVRMIVNDLHEMWHTNGGGALDQRFSRMERDARNVFSLWRETTAIATWECIVDPADESGETMIATGISPAWRELTGMTSADQILDGGWRELVAVDHEERVAAAFKRASAEQVRCSVEFPLVHFTSKLVQPVHWLATPRFDDYDDSLTGWTVQVYSLTNPHVHAHRRATDNPSAEVPA